MSKLQVSWKSHLYREESPVYIVCCDPIISTHTPTGRPSLATGRGDAAAAAAAGFGLAPHGRPSFSFPTTLKAASDNEETPASSSTVKKRKRKVPLPAELLEAQQEDASVSSSSSSSSPPPPPPQGDDLQERLLQDIVKFRKTEIEKNPPQEEATGFAALAGKASSALEKVLIADAFVVLGFTAWFLTGVFFKSVLEDRSVLDGFTAIWMPVIQPALGM